MSEKERIIDIKTPLIEISFLMIIKHMYMQKNIVAYISDSIGKPRITGEVLRASTTKHHRNRSVALLITTVR